MPHRIVIEPLTLKAFSPFGSVVDLPDRTPDIATQHNRYWDAAAPFRVRGIPQIGFLEIYWRSLIVKTIERHLLHTQVFIPLGGTPLIQAVAPPGSDPSVDPGVVRAFLLDGTKGVLLHEGTWHDLLFPLTPTARVILLLQEGTKENDMHVVNLPDAVAIDFPN